MIIPRPPPSTSWLYEFFLTDSEMAYYNGRAEVLIGMAMDKVANDVIESSLRRNVTVEDRIMNADTHFPVHGKLIKAEGVLLTHGQYKTLIENAYMAGWRDAKDRK